jgi:hypothetical protein
MRNILFTLFAIGVAAVAAMTSTTAMLNTPVHPASEVMSRNLQAEQPPAAPAEKKPVTAPGGPTSGAPAPEPAAAGTKPGSGAAPNTDTRDPAADDDTDKDPYEGIAPEELPPDMQYSADSSVSFPTNI